MTSGVRALRQVPLHPRFGAVVDGVDLAAPDRVMTDLLRTALASHGVLLVRGQDLDEGQFEAFSRAIGNGNLELSARSVSHSRERPYVSQLTNIDDADGKPIGFGGNTTDYWHSDQEFREQPASLAALYCKIASRVGGQTSFASTVVANLRMPPATQQRIRLLWSTRMPAPTHDNAVHVEVRHPVVLRSPLDGRLLLYHSENTRRFIGLDDADGLSLKQELLDLILEPHNIYSHSWREGDLIVYDNTQVVHRREAFDGPRWLQGTKIFATPELFAVPAGARC
jgi:taurine dioxygenase